MKVAWTGQEKNSIPEIYPIRPRTRNESFQLKEQAAVYAERLISDELQKAQCLLESSLYRNQPTVSGIWQLYPFAKYSGYPQESRSSTDSWTLPSSGIAVRRSSTSLSVLSIKETPRHEKTVSQFNRWLEELGSTLHQLTFDEDLENSIEKSSSKLFHSPNSQEENVELIFNELSLKLQKDLRSTSSTTEIAMHPLYQQIIGLGKPVVPYLLKGLEQKTGRWFWALKAITREDPVPPEDRGRTRIMTDKWLAWGKEKGYRW